MLRLVVLIGLLVTAAWSAREASWFPFRIPVPLPLTTPHDVYRRGLYDAGLGDTPVGRRWVEASRFALKQPETIEAPVRRSLTFDAASPMAWAFQLALKRGQRLEAVTHVASTTPAEAFVDVFEAVDAVDPNHRDGALRAVDYEAEIDRTVIVRVQPELLRAGRLNVVFRAVPALGFPVADTRARNVQSRFGDPRDAGRRSHEGIDIFAGRGTHVISATDGVVMRVGENRLGGNVVWVWDVSRGLRLYYAHLDEQLVTTGQRVKVGDVIGTVGNTGNARTTAPHLHFGIYENGRGAIDPYWFIAPPRNSVTIARR